jgi:hypothetical protein
MPERKTGQGATAQLRGRNEMADRQFVNAYE